MSVRPIIRTLRPRETRRRGAPGRPGHRDRRGSRLGGRGGGVAASPNAGGAPRAGGWVPVTPELNLPRQLELFVAGDLAVLERDGGAVPGVRRPSTYSRSSLWRASATWPNSTAPARPMGDRRRTSPPPSWPWRRRPSKILPPRSSSISSGVACAGSEADEPWPKERLTAPRSSPPIRPEKRSL